MGGELSGVVQEYVYICRAPCESGNKKHTAEGSSGLKETEKGTREATGPQATSSLERV